MDLKITGQFIKEQRKAKNLTQIQLAEKLNVSEKTISKWECGNGFPDTSLMLPLCEALDVSANELLSGKRLGENEYKTEAEKNLLLLKTAHQRLTKFLLMIEIVLGIISLIPLFVLTIVASYVELADGLRIVLIVVGFVITVVGVYFCILIEKDAGFYECKHCHHKYVPTFSQVLWATHMGRTRYMKCPKCNKKSWQKKVVE